MHETGGDEIFCLPSTTGKSDVMLGLPSEILEQIVVPFDIREHDRVRTCPEEFSDIRTERELRILDLRIIVLLSLGIKAGILI